MLRITTRRTGDALEMKLEGWVKGAWVNELEACWRQALSCSGGMPVQVNLADVRYVDETGRDLMTRMLRGGTRFVATGCVMRELLKELSELVRH